MRRNGFRMGLAIYAKLYSHFNNFCSLYWEVQSLRSVLLKAVLKIFGKFTSMSETYFIKVTELYPGVFRWVFRKISEHFFCRTTANCYFGTKKGRCKY